MANKTSDDIWAIFCQVYKMKLDNPKSAMQVELLAKLSAYVDDKTAPPKRKEKVCSTK